MKMYTAFGNRDHLTPDVRTDTVDEIPPDELTDTGVFGAEVKCSGDAVDWTIVAIATDPKVATQLWQDLKGVAFDLMEKVHP